MGSRRFNKIDTKSLTVDGVSVTGTTQNMVRLASANGYGSTNNKIRRFSNIVTNQGSAITYVDSATLGATFTINQDGVYAISYADSFVAAATAGISLNGTALTSPITSASDAERLTMDQSNAANQLSCPCWTGYLENTDVIRAHTSGAANGSVPQRSAFTIVKVS